MVPYATSAHSFSLTTLTLLLIIVYKTHSLNVFVFLPQIIICGRQVICSYLNEGIEVQLLQSCTGLEGQVQTRKLESSVDPESRLPSYVLEDSEVTGLCVRQQKDQEWSQDVFLKCTYGSNSCVLQVCYDEGVILKNVKIN